MPRPVLERAQTTPYYTATEKPPPSTTGDSILNPQEFLKERCSMNFSLQTNTFISIHRSMVEYLQEFWISWVTLYYYTQSLSPPPLYHCIKHSNFVHPYNSSIFLRNASNLDKRRNFGGGVGTRHRSCNECDYVVSDLVFN